VALGSSSIEAIGDLPDVDAAMDIPPVKLRSLRWRR
jgi:hypothetical protein